MFRAAMANKAFWPANGFLVVVFMALPPRRAPVLALAAGLGYVLITTLTGARDITFALLGAVINVFEALLTAWLCRRLLGADPDFTRVKPLSTFAALCILPSVVVGGAMFDTVYYLIHHSIVWTQYTDWVAEDGFGMLMSTPALWVLMFYRERDLFKAARHERLPALSILLAAESLLFLSSSLPILFLIFPVLVFISFRHGPVGAALAVLITNSVVFCFTIAGQGPLAAMLNAGQDYVALLQQLFVAAATLTALPVAGAIAAQARLRNDLAEREAQARRALAAKSEFLATMSHELRTPLHSIIAYSDMLATTPALAGEAARRAGVIQEASQSLLGVVDDILDYSKIEAGRIELITAPFELETWLETTATIVDDLARRKGLTLEVDLAEGAGGWRVGDGARLRQVLLNLLNNAVKFTAQGGVRLLVGPGALEEAVRFRVQDTGIGISPEAIANLFQRFQQADGSISRAFGGTGLGLAISKRLVELMGGSIGVESEPGVGSTFWFELPLPRFVGDHAGTAPVEPATALTLRVLLVDDLAANREIGRLVLGAIGCEATTVAGAEEALEQLAQARFDVVFMDVHMPGIDGLEAARLIRAAQAPWASIPIIAMTANVLPEQVRACLAAGMDGHIGKPFRPGDLAAILARLGARDADDAKLGAVA